MIKEGNAKCQLAGSKIKIMCFSSLKFIVDPFPIEIPAYVINFFPELVFQSGRDLPFVF